MRKEKYFYNTESLQFERVALSRKDKLIRAGGIICTLLVSSVLIHVLISEFAPSQKERSLMREMEQMEYEYLKMNDKVASLSKVVENVQNRDAQVHRFMFGMDPIDQDVWDGGIGGHDKYQNLTKYNKSGELLINTWQKIDKLRRRVDLQSKSLDTIETYAKKREDMIASIPSIKPIREDKLKRKIKSLSGYGVRMHPIHKVRKMHWGIDFTCPRGTPIQATANGKVTLVKSSRTGFGKHVIIDHGYGYTSLYAHMDRIDVKKGEEVSKGQKIGIVGNTGTSTAPHLHYEVKYKGKHVNPIHYCMDGLSPDEYQELVERSAIANQSFD